MSTILIIIVLIILLGGGGWYAYPRYGYQGVGGLLVLVLAVILIVWLLGGLRY